MRTTPGRPCSTATSRSASAGRTLPARRAAATTATCAMPTPMPSAAASGIHEWPGTKPAGTSPWPEQVDERVRRAAGPAQQAEPARDERDEERLGRDQAADLARGRAERPQDRGLAAPLGDRERERAGDDEQRHEAGDAAHRAEDRDQRLAVARLRVTGVGVGGVGAVEHLEAGALQPIGSTPGERVMTPTALMRPGAPESASAGGGVKKTAAWPRSWLAAPGGDAGDPVGPGRPRRAGAATSPTRSRSASRRRRRAARRRGAGGEAVRSQRRAGPAVAAALALDAGRPSGRSDAGTTRPRRAAVTPGTCATRATASAGSRGAGMTSTRAPDPPCRR